MANDFAARYGPWALVTGASSGIGLELARLAAARGLNVAITGRRADVLRGLAEELQSRHSIQARPLPIDLASPTGASELIAVCTSLPLGLIINSAGFGSGGSFLGADAATERDMVEVNCRALLELTQWASRRFAAQRRGGIVLLSSLVSFQGVPHSPNYAATKAYVQSLAEGIAPELKAYGVDVLSAAPGPVATAFGKRAGMKLPNAEDPALVARHILDALGKQTTVVPGHRARLLFAAMCTAPRSLRVRIMAHVMTGMTRSPSKG